MPSLKHILQSFNSILGVTFAPSEAVSEETTAYLSFIGKDASLSDESARQLLVTDINAKFRLNAGRMASLFAFAAGRKIVLNYHDKRAIGHAFDSGNKSALYAILEKHDLTAAEIDALLSENGWLSGADTIQALHRELNAPTLTRKDSKPRSWAAEILEGLFTGLIANAFGHANLHRFNDGSLPDDGYEPDYARYLRSRFPEMHAGKPRLIVMHLTEHVTSDSEILSRVATAYRSLGDFGYLAIDLPVNTDRSWTSIANILLYAEKHSRRLAQNAFFQAERIQSVTQSCVPRLDPSSARFDVWNYGFFYQDTFVFDGHDQRVLVLLQKREANETCLPCPSCRSLKVQGNSYPSLGVKSWECVNVLCGGKSKFGRGRRYSFVQIVKQAAIEEERNEIPLESVRGWLRDVQPWRPLNEKVEMLVRHYSLAGDLVVFDGLDLPEGDWLGRQIRCATLQDDFINDDNTIDPRTFFDTEWFHRYNVNAVHPNNGGARRTQTIGQLTAFEGDAGAVLAGLASNWLDGAVTSPPYFNAREYSKWENIYCYLHDMRRINNEVFRVLKPGAYYLYNIFDYFDNDNTVVESAMGERRLILSAYTVDLFRRIGFLCVGNVVCDKGDIEGKRGFNGGNCSPFYQAPFNCWEHILIFRKPPDTSPRLKFPAILRQRAVTKIVKGENVHGHSAPFPEALPALLVTQLPAGSTVLDPFAGSMTTAIAAAHRDCRAICIEQMAGYFELGVERYRDAVENVLL